MSDFTEKVRAMLDAATGGTWEAIERIEALEKVADVAKAMRFDGPNVYGAMEVSSGKGTVTSLQAALSAIDAADAEEK